MKNIFENPTEYINTLNKIPLMKVAKEDKFKGKSLAVVFLTKYCNAECEFCIYRSKRKSNNSIKRDYNELDEYRNRQMC